MKRYCLLAAIALQAALAADLSVHVSDPQSKPVQAATVSLLSRQGAGNRIIATDDTGLSRFTGLTPGIYFLQGEAPGFDDSALQVIEIKNGANPEVTLSLGIAKVHSSVVVTASGTLQSTDEVSKSLTVVDGETMALRGDRSIGEALQDVPGVRFQQLGGPGATTYLKMRGLRNSDTAVLVDGLRLRDAGGTQADASGVLQDLVLTNTNRIEVLRGAGSSLYGSNANGGVINIVTDEGGGRTRGTVSLDGGALGGFRGMAHLAGGFQHDRVQYSLGITHWNVTSGVDHANPARNTSGQGMIQYRLSRIATISGRIYSGDSFSFVRLTARSVGALPSTGIIEAVPVSLPEQHRYEAGAPLTQIAIGGASFMPAALNPDSTRAGRFFTGSVRLNIRPTESLGLTAEYQGLTTRRDYGDGPAGPASQPAGSSISKYDGAIQTANIRLDSRLGRYNHFDTGYEFEAETFQNRLLPPAQASNFFTDVTQRSNSLYAQDQLKFFDGRLQFAAAYRAQFFALNKPYFEPANGAPYNTNSFAAPPTAQTGDASLAYTLCQTGTKIRTHAGRGYRSPSLYERFGVFFSGTKYTLYGDPALKPERSSSIDGGIDQMLFNSRLQLSGTYFYTKLNQVVLYDTSTNVINPVTDPLGRSGGYRNTGGALARGVEMSASAAVTRTLQMSAAYTYTDGRQRTPVVAGVWQTFEVPRQMYSFTATKRLSSRLTSNFAYIGSSDYLYQLSGRAYRFSGRTRGQLGLSYRQPLSDHRAVRYYFRADNIFNQTNFDNGFRTPGATGTGGMQFEF